MIAVKAQYEEILSIHIYSLSPGPINVIFHVTYQHEQGLMSLQNVHMLSDCNQQITTKYAHEDPLVFNEKYGVIQNPRVKVSIVFNHVYAPRLPTLSQRRTGARPPPPPAVIEPAKPTSYRPEPTKTETKSTKASERPLSSSTTAKSETKPATQPKPLETKPVDRKPSLKKEKSDIFKSFGKTKAPTTKLRREETDTSAASVAASTREDGSSS